MGMFDLFRRKRNVEEEELEEEELTLNEQAKLSRVNVAREFEAPAPKIDEGARMEESLREYMQEKPVAPEPVIEPVPSPEPEISEQEIAKARIESLKAELEEKKLKSELDKYSRTGQLKEGIKETAKSIFSQPKGKDSTAQRATRVVRNVATLGGAVRISQSRKDYYVPKARPGFYVPKMKSTTAKPDRSLYNTGSMRKLTSPQQTQMSATYTQPATTKQGLDLSRLRQAGSLSSSSPIAQMARGNQSPMARPMAMARRSAPAVTIGRRSIDIPSTEILIGEWDGETIYFWDLPEEKSVRGIDVVLTRTANGLYRFRGVSEDSFSPVSRIIGKNPPQKGQKFGPIRRRK